MPKLNEMNYISEELNRNMRFELKFEPKEQKFYTVVHNIE